MAEQAGDKKHDASPFRREKAREEGNVVRSQDLGSAMLLLISVVVLDYTGPHLVQTLAALISEQFKQPLYWETDSRTPLVTMVSVSQKAAIALTPLLATVFFAAVVINVGQTGFLWLPNKLGFDFTRIDPMKGFARLFSLQNATRLGFGLMKIGIVVFILVLGIWSRWDSLLNLSGLAIESVGGFIWATVIDLVRQVAIALVILAILDYGFQKWKYEQDLMMTDEEVREEAKSTQGDPQVKARRRRIQREIASQRLMSDVPKADVVITNPTELAIALRYDPKTMKAPVVVAKGAELVAARIRKIALEHGIPIVERKPLAQALYKNVDVGKAIPVEQYAAVAEVLKYVYQVRNRSISDLLKSA
ncbi:MAG: flagellar biosynthesis protein FlhB [Pirellulaceae bacterium]|nr:flagellar biosynthesis protein FlhB [Pirellulaceae bacterium]